MAVQLPPFLFTISEIRQNPIYPPRTDANGIWYPPRRHGASYILNSPTNGKWYYFDGAGSLYRLSSRQENWTEYKTYSVYFDNARYWSVPYDATKQQVGNGYDQIVEEGDDDETMAVQDVDTGYYYDWKPLRFNNPNPSNQKKPAMVKYPGCDKRLHAQHNGQTWVGTLLPQCNHAGHISTNVSHGGLVGDLPLLLALVAFSAKPDAVEQTLQYTLGISQLPWNTPPNAGEGREDERGVVVTVYEAPEWRGLLDKFEKGRLGKIFA